MVIRVDTYPEERVILVTVERPLHLNQDVKQTMASVVEFKQTVDVPVVRILDFRKIELTLGELTQGMWLERGRHGGNRDPEMIPVVIGNSELMRLAPLAVGEQMFGGRQIKLVKNLEEAMAYARMVLGGEAQLSNESN